MSMSRCASQSTRSVSECSVAVPSISVERSASPSPSSMRCRETCRRFVQYRVSLWPARSDDGLGSMTSWGHDRARLPFAITSCASRILSRHSHEVVSSASPPASSMAYCNAVQVPSVAPISRYFLGVRERVVTAIVRKFPPRLRSPRETTQLRLVGHSAH
jgi:hypothetical protein